ncbi:MAG: glutamate synthase central domain-containing protein, partial [bacterium]|nr:glutamate synthase central domain-containing protein [bacterium]
MKPQGLYDPRYEHDSCGVGFVCNIKGQRSNEIVRQGLEVLNRLAHRGATGSDPKTGDGAGILIQLPHEFFSQVCAAAGINLPAAGKYGAGMVFLPTDPKEREYCKKKFAAIVKNEKCEVLGWRPVPVDNSVIGKTARETEPVIEQVFVSAAGAKAGQDTLYLERKLYIIRKLVENAIRDSHLQQKSFFYITNLSSRTFSYKGLLMPDQVAEYFIDLKDPALHSAISLVHSRYSTNTFPTWDLAQPFRFLAHNGEINTLRGNINWMRAKEGLLKSKLFGEDLKRILPTIVPEGSDSASIDNVFELMVLAGRSLAHSMTMLIPSVWEHNDLMDQQLKDFYMYHTCLMEPWDGPAAIAFTDGRQIGAVLDRNGLRPARYLVTKKGLVVMASEVGVLDIPPQDILYSGRLEPGKMFFIDTEAGRIIDDRELREQMSGRNPYGDWIKDNMLELDSLPEAVMLPLDKSAYLKSTDILTDMKAFGYSREDLKTIIKPMVDNGQEPVGSMGNDTPHAVLS